MTPLPNEVALVSVLLKTKVRDAGWSLRSVARSLEWHEDYLSQLLRGNPPLKVEHLFAVLRVLRIRPQDFFGELAESFRRAEEAERETGREPIADAAKLRELIDTRIRELLGEREELQRREGA